MGGNLEQKRNQEAARIHVELGLRYLQQGNVGVAKQRLLTAREQAPQDPLVWSAMGYYLESVGEIEEAEEHYRTALQLDPHSGEMLNNYGTFLCRRGQHRQAIEYFKAALQDDEYLNKAELYENAGICASYIPDFIQAEQLFSLALEREPNRSKTLYELAELYQKQGQIERAYEYITRYLHHAVEPPDYALELGIQLAKQKGKHHEAETYSRLRTQRKLAHA